MVYCTELLPNRLCCIGCIQFTDKALPIEKFTEPNLCIANTKQPTSHTHTRFRCSKPWLIERGAATEADNNWIVKIHNYIDAAFPSGHGRGINTAADDGTGEQETQLVTPGATPHHAIGNNVNELPMPKNLNPNETKTPKRKEDVKTRDITIKSAGFEFVIKDVPLTHDVKHNSVFGMWENAYDKMKKLRETFNQEQFTSKASEHMRTLLATALAACPTFALSTLAHIIPLLVGASLVDAGVLDFKTFNINKFSTLSFCVLSS